MSQLANAFALLELDVPDNKEPSTAKVADNHGKTKRGGKGKNKTGNTARTITSEKENKTGNSADTITSEKENKTGNSANATTSETEIGPRNSLEVPQSQYKMPLVWIDLEMTGLHVEVDKILEIACIITDGNLTKLIEGPHLVIFQSKECLDGMGEWCQTHHAASGLTEKVLKSKVSEKEAEKRVIEFVEKHVGSYTPLLAGNSVYTDFIFLKKYMPDLASLFSHVLVDVSSVKALCVRWYPKENKKAPSKENKHRALEDIKESIAELKYYKENIFKPSQSKK